MYVQQTQLKSFFKYDVWFVYLFKKKKYFEEGSTNLGFLFSKKNTSADSHFPSFLYCKYLAFPSSV